MRPARQQTKVPMESLGSAKCAKTVVRQPLLSSCGARINNATFADSARRASAKSDLPGNVRAPCSRSYPLSGLRRWGSNREVAGDSETISRNQSVSQPRPRIYPNLLWRKTATRSLRNCFKCGCVIKLHIATVLALSSQRRMEPQSCTNLGDVLLGALSDEHVNLLPCRFGTAVAERTPLPTRRYRLLTNVAYFAAEGSHRQNLPRHASARIRSPRAAIPLSVFQRHCARQHCGTCLKHRFITNMPVSLTLQCQSRRKQRVNGTGWIPGIPRITRIGSFILGSRPSQRNAVVAPESTSQVAKRIRFGVSVRFRQASCNPLLRSRKRPVRMGCSTPSRRNPWCGARCFSRRWPLASLRVPEQNFAVSELPRKTFKHKAPIVREEFLPEHFGEGMRSKDAMAMPLSPKSWHLQGGRPPMAREGPLRSTWFFGAHGHEHLSRGCANTKRRKDLTAFRVAFFATVPAAGWPLQANAKNRSTAVARRLGCEHKARRRKSCEKSLFSKPRREEANSAGSVNNETGDKDSDGAGDVGDALLLELDRALEAAEKAFAGLPPADPAVLESSTVVAPPSEDTPMQATENRAAAAADVEDDGRFLLLLADPLSRPNHSQRSERIPGSGVEKRPTPQRYSGSGMDKPPTPQRYDGGRRGYHTCRLRVGPEMEHRIFGFKHLRTFQRFNKCLPIRCLLDKAEWSSDSLRERKPRNTGSTIRTFACPLLPLQGAPESHKNEFTRSHSRALVPVVGTGRHCKHLSIAVGCSLYRKQARRPTIKRLQTRVPRPSALAQPTTGEGGIQRGCYIFFRLPRKRPVRTKAQHDVSVEQDRQRQIFIERKSNQRLRMLPMVARNVSSVSGPRSHQHVVFPVQIAPLAAGRRALPLLARPHSAICQKTHVRGSAYSFLPVQPWQRETSEVGRSLLANRCSHPIFRAPRSLASGWGRRGRRTSPVGRSLCQQHTQRHFVRRSQTGVPQSALRTPETTGEGGIHRGCFMLFRVPRKLPVRHPRETKVRHDISHGRQIFDWRKSIRRLRMLPMVTRNVSSVFAGQGHRHAAFPVQDAPLSAGRSALQHPAWPHSAIRRDAQVQESAVPLEARLARHNFGSMGATRTSPLRQTWYPEKNQRPSSVTCGRSTATSLQSVARRLAMQTSCPIRRTKADHMAVGVRGDGAFAHFFDRQVQCTDSTSGHRKFAARLPDRAL